MVWVTVAMVGARTLAMSLNRLVDAELDARNPRTATRELPSGALSRAQVLGLCVLSLAVFLRRGLPARSGRPLAVADPGRDVRRSTRTSSGSRGSATSGSGACLGLAPVGAWLAVTGTAPWEAWAIGGAVLLWVAGFDLFYSLFDLEHDRAEGLHSWAVRFGERGVFVGARVFHAGTVAAARRWRASGSTSRSSTGSVWSRRRRCSPTSTRSCGPATCDGSTPRSSRSTA